MNIYLRGARQMDYFSACGLQRSKRRADLSSAESPRLRTAINRFGLINIYLSTKKNLIKLSVGWVFCALLGAAFHYLFFIFMGQKNPNGSSKRSQFSSAIGKKCVRRVDVIAEGLNSKEEKYESTSSPEISIDLWDKKNLSYN